MRKYIKRLKARIALNKKQFITYSILRTLVILTAAFLHGITRVWRYVFFLLSCFSCHPFLSSF